MVRNLEAVRQSAIDRVAPFVFGWKSQGSLSRLGKPCCPQAFVSSYIFTSYLSCRPQADVQQSISAKMQCYIQTIRAAD